MIYIGTPTIPPAAASAVGYTLNTFSSTSLANSVGNLYYPAGFYGYSGGTVVQNVDGSITLSNGGNLPQVATAHYDNTKANNWGGLVFGCGGYFDTYAAWTPYSHNSTGWPSGGLYDVNTTANNSAGSWNLWGTQSITANGGSGISSGATTATIPAWAGTITLTGTVTFSDAETRSVAFTAGATSISWTGGLTNTVTSALSVSWGSTYVNFPEWDIYEADTGVTTSVGIDGIINWYGVFGGGAKTQTSFSAITGINTAVPHHYAGLWVPATGSTAGYAKWYFDGTLVNTATWAALYNSATPPAPAGTQTNTHLWTGGNAFSVMDGRLMVPIWNTSAANAPMTIYSFNVWQLNASCNVSQ